jgi:cytosine/adenosine deaminase-related metal-dependent hydrolase
MTDIVIHNAFILTVNDRNQLFERGTIVVEDGRIRDVRKTCEGDTTLNADHVIDGTGMIAMPGLINTHAHLEQTALFGAFSDLSVREMMTAVGVVYEQIGEGEFEYFAEAGYELAALNFLNSGITTVNSMDSNPHVGANVFGEAGLRAFFGAHMSDLVWDVPVDEQIARTRSFIEDHHDSYDGRIQATICPSSDWSCTRDLWLRVADLAAEHPDLPIHTHVLELEQGNTIARSNGASDSLSLLNDIGLLDERLIAAHFRVADDDDARRLATADAAVAHCPSIFCYWNPGGSGEWMPVPTLQKYGATIGLGLDDHYWHDSYNLFGEARQARLVANREWEGNQFSSMKLVRMLTLDGARALGVADSLGSLTPGKQADIILLDIDKPKFKPLTNIPALVVNTASAADVETVIVDGTVLMRDGDILSMDAAAVGETVSNAVDRFGAEMDWELDIGGNGKPPGILKATAKLPKRGPAHLLGRIGLQLAKDKLEL